MSPADGFTKGDLISYYAMRKYWIGFLWFALFPLNASAQLIASAYVGESFTRDADIHVTRPPDTNVVFNDVGFDGRSFEGPLYFGVRGGYMFKPSIGLEGEYIHIKAYARVDDPVTVTGTLPGSNGATSTAPVLVLQQYGVSHGLNLILGNVVLRRDVAPRLGVSFRGGLGIAIPHPEIRVFNTTILNHYEVHGAAFQLAAGGDFQLVDHVFWLAEYKFTYSSQHFEPGSVTVANTFATQQVVTGLGWRF